MTLLQQTSPQSPPATPHLERSQDCCGTLDRIHLMEWKVTEEEGAATSFFEFWPNWLIYLPVVIQWLLLSIRYRSLTIPFIANPRLPLAGMVGVAKSELMVTATGSCRKDFLPWIAYKVDKSPALDQAQLCVKLAHTNGIDMPLVCKPDIGCRGAGVKLIHTSEALASVIALYPEGANLLCQKLASWEPEAGVFFVKYPGSESGQVVSLTFKYTPYVLGDGVQTLQQFVAADKRAGQLLHLYEKRHKAIWLKPVPLGKKQKLVFSASHCRGAIFRDAREHITPLLTKKINEIMDGLPEFYYGRLDIKFSSIENLREGRDIEIIEINGASAESIHIWDKNAKLLDAIKTLLWQYRTLFRLGAAQAKRGVKVPSIKEFLARWRNERRLTKFYPTTD